MEEKSSDNFFLAIFFVSGYPFWLQEMQIRKRKIFFLVIFFGYALVKFWAFWTLPKMENGRYGKCARSFASFAPTVKPRTILDSWDSPDSKTPRLFDFEKILVKPYIWTSKNGVRTLGGSINKFPNGPRPRGRWNLKIYIQNYRKMLSAKSLLAISWDTAILSWKKAIFGHFHPFWGHRFDQLTPKHPTGPRHDLSVTKDPPKGCHWRLGTAYLPRKACWSHQREVSWPWKGLRITAGGLKKCVSKSRPNRKMPLIKVVPPVITRSDPKYFVDPSRIGVWATLQRCSEYWFEHLPSPHHVEDQLQCWDPYPQS